LDALLKNNKAKASSLQLEQTLSKLGRKPGPQMSAEELAVDMAMRPGRKTPTASSKPGEIDLSGSMTPMGGMARPSRRQAVSSGRPASTRLNPNGRDEGSVRSIYLF
jgi:hypothetical protein